MTEIAKRYTMALSPLLDIDEDEQEQDNLVMLAQFISNSHEAIANTDMLLEYDYYEGLGI